MAGNAAFNGYQMNAKLEVLTSPTVGQNYFSNMTDFIADDNAVRMGPNGGSQ